jgi:uncharacterized membrane protein
MPDPIPDANEKETGRLEAFSDGVFSIAMTLLVLELKVPTFRPPITSTALLTALRSQWPSYLAFLTSFATVLIMWVNHHGIFRLVRRCDAMLLFTNGLLLLFVTVVPFPTALVAAYLRTAGAAAACTIYCATFVVGSLMYGVLLLVAARHGGRMLVPHAAAEVRRRVRDCFGVGVPLYALATAMAPIKPWVSLSICTALWVYWSAGSIERREAFGR